MIRRDTSQSVRGPAVLFQSMNSSEESGFRDCQWDSAGVRCGTAWSFTWRQAWSQARPSLKAEMGDSSFSLNKLRRVLAPVMDQVELNQRLNDATVGFVEQAPDICHRKFLVRKQVADGELSLFLWR